MFYTLALLIQYANAASKEHFEGYFITPSPDGGNYHLALKAESSCSTPHFESAFLAAISDYVNGTRVDGSSDIQYESSGHTYQHEAAPIGGDRPYQGCSTNWHLWTEAGLPQHWVQQIWNAITSNFDNYYDVDDNFLPYIFITSAIVVGVFCSGLCLYTAWRQGKECLKSGQESSITAEPKKELLKSSEKDIELGSIPTSSNIDENCFLIKEAEHRSYRLAPST